MLSEFFPFHCNFVDLIPHIIISGTKDGRVDVDENGHVALTCIAQGRLNSLMVFSM